METSIEKVAELAQDQLDREAAKNPVLKNALNVVEKFLKNNRVLCYGGTAINNLLPVEDRFYDPDRDIPDYDFFSESPQLHAVKLADQLTDEGYSSVEVKPGVHVGTYKVFADYNGVADISYMDETIFRKMWNEGYEKGGIHYVSPNFLRMSVYLELSRPKGFVERWKKVYKRLQLLNKHYPMSCPASQVEINNTHLTDDAQEMIEKIMIEEDAVLLGFNAANYQSKKRSNWMLPLDILATPQKRDDVAKKLMSAFKEEDIKQVDKPAFEELIAPHTDISSKKTGHTLIRIYETQACHSYHQTPDKLMVASIPTLLQFFLSILYAPKYFQEDIPEQRFLCTAQHLVEMANSNLPRRYKLLTPITCIGKQKTLIDMRAQKSDMYVKLSKDKNSREFLEYFFTYTPTTLTKTQKQKIKSQLHKTFRRRRQQHSDRR
jgi:hypothetical protein